MKKIWKKGQRYKLLIHVFFVVTSLCFILPLIMVVSISLSSERAVTGEGYSLFPREFTTDAYKLAFADSDQMLSAYAVTASQALIGTFGVLVVAGMVAYSLSRSNFAYKKQVTFIVFFTLLCSGGSIPLYIVTTK